MARYDNSLPFETSSLAILAARLDGTIFWLNQAARQLFNLNSANQLTMQQFVDPATTASIMETCDLATFEVDVKIRNLVLKKFLLVVNSDCADPDSAFVMIAFFDTQTALHRGQQHTELLATAAHDLKNPLGAIFGYADILLDTEAGKGLNQQQKEIATRIRQTALRSLELVRNYQQLISISQPQGVAPYMRSELNAVVTAVMESTWRKDQRVAPLNSDLASRELWINAHKVQLERIASNLIGNAIKYTPQYGKIEVRTFLESPNAVLEVYNSESYIKPEEQTQIFELAKRGSSAGEVSGSGLGLYIVKSIVNSLRGKVTVESSPQQGTCFRITLPTIEE
ncbi:MAG: HAMP domain-containing histidine kinase [Bdellovibrionales bacterium]|nr:HAMP domain-containing histidine kinase [Bdellovibrionales bacterium]